MAHNKMESKVSEANQQLEVTSDTKSPLTAPDIHDRVTDAYYGKLGEQFMRETQARIHWICAQVIGSRVLDVGCSQGIVPILLAREGCNVTGVDTSPKAIEEAEAHLSLEPKHIQEKITYINADFISLNVDEVEVDTVILSEILEHLVRPELFVEKAAKILSSSGNLIITVPFGINDYIDHKHTFYLKEPYEIVAKYFADIEVEMLGKWLGIVATNVIDGETEKENLIDHKLITKLENAFNKIERNLHDDLKDKSEHLNNANNKYREATTRITEINKKLKDLSIKNKADETIRNELQEKLHAREQELKTAQATSKKLLKFSSWRITAPLRWMTRRFGKLRPSIISRKFMSTLARIRRDEDVRSTVQSTTDMDTIRSATIDVVAKAKKRRRSPMRLKDLRVAAIMDTFTKACFEPECELVTFRPDNWQEILSEAPPDLLFVESAWNGNDGAWQYRVGEYAASPGKELLDLVAWCKNAGIQTIFWNKEDPSHFDKFIKSALLFDWIFTTDANCIPRYREHCGHERVFALPFAAQPAIHKPLLSEPRNSKICFAGTYYGDRFDARRKAMEILLRPALEFDFEIYDRMHGAVGPGAESYRFPEEYVPHIVGRLEYKDMVNAYRRYRVFLNVNSVADSSTMFSRRVFELLACGTPVVSTESLGIRKMFPGIVSTVATDDEAREAITKLVEDNAFWQRCSALGIRRVMEAHTYQHRFRRICETVGLEIDPDLEKEIVLAVVPGPEPKITAEQLASQTHQPQTICLVNNQHAQALKNSLEKVGFFGAPIRIVDSISSCIDKKSDVIVAIIDGKHSYGPGYLHDGLMALNYSGALSTSMTSHYQATSDGGIELTTNLGEHNILTKRVKRASFLCPARALSAAFLDSIFNTEILELTEPCFARGPFEFLAGAVLPLNDDQMKKSILEESLGDDSA